MVFQLAISSLFQLPQSARAALTPETHFKWDVFGFLAAVFDTSLIRAAVISAVDVAVALTEGSFLSKKLQISILSKTLPASCILSNTGFVIPDRPPEPDITKMAHFTAKVYVFADFLKKLIKS